MVEVFCQRGLDRLPSVIDNKEAREADVNDTLAPTEPKVLVTATMARHHIHGDTAD
jgi:hypothetical protein